MNNTKFRVSFLVLSAAACCGFVIEPVSALQADQENDKTLAEFEPRVVIPRAFKAIVEPKTVSAEQADDSLHPGELVLGIQINGKARAYPINMLTGPQREIINDVIGDTPIAATW